MNVADVNMANTTITMPSSAVTITANFADGNTPPHVADNSPADWSISQSEIIC